MHNRIIWLSLMIFVFTGCNSIQQGLFSRQSPHEEYRSKLATAGLDNSKLGQKWINAAEEFLSNPAATEVPYSEAVVFDYENFTTATYRLQLREGQNLHVLVEPEHPDTSHIFIDLFRLTNSEYKHEEYAEKDSLILNYRIRNDGEYIVRIQPELLVTGLFTVYLFTDASLNFPVPGKDFNSISSFFGDPRDGGKRKHEGIDIFAPKGTPVLAVSSGRIIRTGKNRLGGKVVWMTNTSHGYNYYYAHLDSQLVMPGQHVHPGDTLGLMGNTGNAITTPPHLHFGIYAYGRRSIDPYAFFHRTEMNAVDSVLIEQYADAWVQISSERANFRSGPALDTGIIETLPSGIPLKIKAVTNEWLFAELPDGKRGYIHQSLVQPVEESGTESIAAGIIIRNRPDSASGAKKITGQNEKVTVYAEYGSYLLIEAGGVMGWINENSGTA